MGDQPIVTITAQQMFEMLTRMEAVTNKLVDGLGNLKEIAEDHEDRLRVVEASAGAEKRIDDLSDRVTQHDAAFSKINERVGGIEGVMAGQKASKISPVAVAGVVAAFSAIVVNIIIALIKA